MQTPVSKVVQQKKQFILVKKDAIKFKKSDNSKLASVQPTLQFQAYGDPFSKSIQPKISIKLLKTKNQSI
jgi:hypothetical protein